MRVNSASIKQQLLRQASRTIDGVDEHTRGLQESFGIRDRAEPWTMPQVRFSENARAAARRALWYLRLVEVDSDDMVRAHAQEKAFDQLRAVAVPPPAECCGPDSTLPCDYKGASLRYAQLLTLWEDTKKSLGGALLTPDEMASQAKALASFVAGSSPLDWWISATYVRIPAIKRTLRQHFALLLALVLVAALFRYVEAVNALLRNDIIITALYLTFVMAPIAILERARIYRERRKRSAPWDIGGRVVHDFPACEEPESWLAWHPPGYEERVFKGLLYKVLAYLLGWLLVGLLVAAMVQSPIVDDVSLTVYLILALCAVVTLVGGVLDFADMHSRAPLRGIVVTGIVLVGIVLLYTDSAWWIAGSIVLWLVIIELWARQVRNSRVVNVVPRTIAGLATVLLVTHCAGVQGEARKLHRGTIVPIALDQWPRGDSADGPIVVLAASGGGSRAAIYTARTLTSLETAYPEVAARLQAISSVSGGSLASAAYIARRLRATGLVPDSVVEPCHAALVDALKSDFIAPVILGMPFGGRGNAIEREWARCPVNLGSVDIGTLARLWRDVPGRLAPFPVPVFNSVNLERHAVVITPLEQKFFELPFDPEARDLSLTAYRKYDRPTWVHYRSGIYHLSDIADSANLLLAAAVRASANFPFGFPLVEIPTRKPLFYSPSISDTTPDSLRTPRPVRLTDGGALSNSGMWPLVPMLRRQLDRIGNNRGVLLIVVDASRMPGAPAIDRQRGLYETIMDKDPKGERLHLLMLQQLEAMFGECLGYVHIGIAPSRKFNVYTTWALDRESTELVEEAFADAWPAAAARIEGEYRRLSTCHNTGDPRRWLASSTLRGRVPIN